jgi:hypothetical protein
MTPIQFMLHYSADFENMPVFFAIQRWWRQGTEAITTQKARAALLLRMLKNKATQNSVARIVTNEKMPGFLREKIKRNFKHLEPARLGIVPASLVRGISENMS